MEGEKQIPFGNEKGNWRDGAMGDAIAVVVVAALFAVGLVYVTGCERLKRGSR
jgi:hypothetical protein